MRIAVRIGLHLKHVFGAQVMTVVQQVVDARGAIRLLPAVSQVRLVVRSDDARVCSGDESACGIQRLRQLIEWNVADPLVIVRIARNGDLPMSLLTNRDSRRYDVADVAFDVRVNGVLPGTPYALHRLAKLFPVAGFAQPVVTIR